MLYRQISVTTRSLSRHEIWVDQEMKGSWNENGSHRKWPRTFPLISTHAYNKLVDSVLYLSISIYHCNLTSGEGYSTNVSASRSNPLPCYTPFFHEKGTPFVYLPLTNRTSFSHHVLNFASLLIINYQYLPTLFGKVLIIKSLGYSFNS